jgi:hypothetical protein
MIRRLHPGVCVVLAFALVALWVAGALASDRRFAGKFELVPLFERGRPMLRNGHSYYAVRNSLAFRTDAGEILQVHGGQTTDLASIPQVVWPLLPPDGPWAEAAVFHDVCYRSRGSMGFPPKHILGRAQPFDRAGCDEVLREAMVALGVADWKRVAIWSAVRAFGGLGWGS